MAYSELDFRNGLAAGLASTPGVRLERPAGCAQYFVLLDQMCAYSPQPVNEYGLLIVPNSGGVITRAGCSLRQVASAGNVWRRTPAVRGENLTSVRVVPYLGYNGAVAASAFSTAGDAEPLLMYELVEKNGVWSHGGAYHWFQASVRNTEGALLTDAQLRAVGIGMRIFSNQGVNYDVSELKAYMEG